VCGVENLSSNLFSTNSFSGSIEAIASLKDFYKVSGLAVASILGLAEF
jgi:hypothetical protein